MFKISEEVVVIPHDQTDESLRPYHGKLVVILEGPFDYREQANIMGYDRGGWDWSECYRVQAKDGKTFWACHQVLEKPAPPTWDDIERLVNWNPSKITNMKELQEKLGALLP